jgi:hypothetical protein
MFDGGKVPVERLIDALQSNLDAHVSRDDFATPDNEPVRSYDVDGDVADITVISIQDFNCDPNADFHPTFNQKLYRIDLVFTSSSPTDRQTARNKLFRSARQVGAKLQNLYKCP